MLHQNPDDTDPKAVERDGDRYRGEKDECTNPQRRLVKVRDNETDAHQREQVTQAVAGFGDLKLVEAEVDDVAFEEDADPHGSQKTHAEVRRDQLEEGGQVLVQEHGQRDHEEQQSEGDRDLPHDTPSGERRDGARQDHQECVLDQDV